MSKTVIAIVGPTAIGKTSKAITLARYFNTEIVSADSRQFYKQMRIGTAVPTQEELKAAKHHFIQHINITDPYTVGDFEKDAMECITSLFKSHEVVVIVGGSGLYMDAVLYGLDSFPEVPIELREQLNARLQMQGIEALQMELRQLDPEYYARVDLENPHRVIRALEVSLTAGQPYSSFLGKEKRKRPFNYVLLGLEAERTIIYERINQRVDAMIQQGLLDEVKALVDHKNVNALNTVGYKELFPYFEGRLSLEEAIETIKRNTRRFAKRQLTWYRKNQEVTWFDHTIAEDVFCEQVAQLLSKK